MFTGKNILITSGGTQEYIDDVRVLTNISSGKLGALIAENMDGATVHYVHGKNAAMPTVRPSGLHKAVTAMDAYKVMKELVPSMDAVIHCMAVSDFTFKRDKAIKCKSSDPQAFIDYMRDTITVNPKIISEVKTWNPKTILVGFKFEVGLEHEDLIALARASIEKNHCDMVVANDKKEMNHYKEHIAYMVLPGEEGISSARLVGKEAIVEGIRDFLKASFMVQGLEL